MDYDSEIASTVLTACVVYFRGQVEVAFCCSQRRAESEPSRVSPLRSVFA